MFEGRHHEHLGPRQALVPVAVGDLLLLGDLRVVVHDARARTEDVTQRVRTVSLRVWREVNVNVCNV